MRNDDGIDRSGYVYEGPHGTPRDRRDYSPDTKLKTTPAAFRDLACHDPSPSSRPAPSLAVRDALAEVGSFAPCFNCGGVLEGNTCCPPDADEMGGES